MTPVRHDPTPRRVFVVGVPRSGTTLLQGLLAAHSDVTSFTETHFFSRHYRRLPGLERAVLWRDPLPRVRAFLGENGIIEADVVAELEAIAAADRGPLPRVLRGRRVASALLALLDAIARRRGAAVWVEKTPMHLHYVGLLQRAASSAGSGSSGSSGSSGGSADSGGSVRATGGEPPRFLHLIRGGVEVVASLMAASRQWERSYDLDESVARWNADVARSLRLCRAMPARHLPVCYEDLVADPERVLRMLLPALGLAFEPAMFDRRAAATAALIAPHESWKAGSDGAIRSAGTAAHALSDAQRERVRAGLAEGPFAELRRLAAEPRP